MDINYWGALHCTQSFLPLIRRGKRKSMVYLSSLSAQCTPPFFTAYAATKHALRGFVLSLRQELGPEGIHVGMVSPGPIETPLIENEIHGDMYRLPAGIPVLKPEAAAKGVLRTVMKRKKDLVLPGRIGAAARLAGAFPSLVDVYYRISIPDWNNLILAQTGQNESEQNPVT
jgi:NAD(P)-dependent dehydrogenase (short-subunit alcohol dehydrogenase family)